MLDLIQKNLFALVIGFTICGALLLSLAGCGDNIGPAGKAITATVVPDTTVSKNTYPTTPTPTKPPVDPNKKQPPTDLTEKVWTLQTYKGVDQKNSSEHVEITFKADGTISGLVNCNAFWGIYTTGDNNTIKINTTSDPMCYGDSSSIYGYKLDSARSYEITGNTLQLKDNTETIWVFSHL